MSQGKVVERGEELPESAQERFYELSGKLMVNGHSQQEADAIAYATVIAQSTELVLAKANELH